jgi:hypothetical protein
MKGIGLVLGVLILPLSTIFLLNFGTIPTVWYFCYSFYQSFVNILLVYYLSISAITLTWKSSEGTVLLKYSNLVLSLSSGEVD